MAARLVAQFLGESQGDQVRDWLFKTKSYGMNGEGGLARRQRDRRAIIRPSVMSAFSIDLRNVFEGGAQARHRPHQQMLSLQ
jgi:hypothetical protein